MANERVRIAIELARRGVTVQLTDEEIASATNEQLEALFGVALAATGSEPSVRTAAPVGAPSAPPVGRIASSVRTRMRGPSISDAVLQACSARQLDAAGIVEAVLELRPGTNPPSVYPEIKRSVERGHLQRFGRAEPYTYRTVPAMRA
jgi:hypothetical protein